MGEPEKRAHQRTAVAYPVRVRSTSGAEYEGTVENLGALGALVSTVDLEASIVVGDRVKLSIETPEGDLVEAVGEILRLEQEFARGEIRRSFAVRFSGEVAA
ncbi:MAG: PilZ domain-containing protein [Planctomycetota bacterium]|jgi:hypothetical protein